MTRVVGVGVAGVGLYALAKGSYRTGQSHVWNSPACWMPDGLDAPVLVFSPIILGTLQRGGLGRGMLCECNRTP